MIKMTVVFMSKHHNWSNMHVKKYCFWSMYYCVAILYGYCIKCHVSNWLDIATPVVTSCLPVSGTLRSMSSAQVWPLKPKASHSSRVDERGNLSRSVSVTCHFTLESVSMFSTWLISAWVLQSSSRQYQWGFTLCQCLYEWVPFSVGGDRCSLQFRHNVTKMSTCVVTYGDVVMFGDRCGVGNHGPVWSLWPRNGHANIYTCRQPYNVAIFAQLMQCV